MSDVAAPPAPSILEVVRRRYFSSVGNTLLTVVSLALLGTILWKVLDWAVFTAVFSTSGGPEACRGADGACWSVIGARWRLIFFGLYPYEEHWRSGLACLVVVVMTVLSCMPRFWSMKAISVIWIGGFAVFYVLMKGGVLGLVRVDEQNWGGLALTVFIFVTTVIIGMPLSLAWALLRRSELKVVSRVTAVIIDSVRSLPLVSILFTFAIVLPFVLPDWLTGDKLYRAIIGSALFFSAYQAEIIRGGFQGVPKGQEEAAKALGLGYWLRIGKILLPQAFKNALPATINQFVITFKETSLFIIIGFFEVLASGNAAYGTGDWTFAYVEVYVFIAAIYFAFVFSLSRYGAFLERRMDAGDRR
ncbi:amino acid ABC transporter permease [Acuticoccus sediminis]|uniref:Amino acid ABC transporter permease n=1 Tax=Acuticoccus sediminis TaxID=2184697 RepID=A0A8B2NRZ6_9HYPH|nr:amino acid ABC transporter permease [Acuticoccus sediminis]RAI01681.1 amino acid ABC transporter permease [Acuticoccus sediminis]